MNELKRKKAQKKVKRDGMELIYKIKGRKKKVKLVNVYRILKKDVKNDV